MLPFETLLKRKKRRERDVKTALTTLTSERGELSQLKTDKQTALGDLPGQLETAKGKRDLEEQSLISERDAKKIEMEGTWDPKTQTGTGKKGAIEALKLEKKGTLGGIAEQIGHWNPETRKGSGLVEKLVLATEDYNKAYQTYTTAEGKFAETASGKLMSGFKEKYGRYDPELAQAYKGEIETKMKEDPLWSKKGEIETARGKLNKRLKDLGKSPNMFWAEIGDDDSVKFYGDDATFDLMRHAKPIDGMGFKELLFQEASSKKYFGNYEKEISTAQSDYEKQFEVAYGTSPGRTAIRGGGRGGGRVIAGDSNKFKKIYETQEEWKKRTKQESFDEWLGRTKADVTYDTGTKTESFGDWRTRTKQKSFDDWLKEGHDIEKYDEGVDVESFGDWRSRTKQESFEQYIARVGSKDESGAELSKPQAMERYHKDLASKYKTGLESGDVLKTPYKIPVHLTKPQAQEKYQKDLAGKYKAGLESGDVLTTEFKTPVYKSKEETMALYTDEMTGKYTKALKEGNLEITGYEKVDATDYETFLKNVESSSAIMDEKKPIIDTTKATLGEWDPDTKKGTGLMGDYGTKEIEYDTKITDTGTTWDTNITTTVGEYDTEIEGLDKKHGIPGLEGEIEDVSEEFDPKISDQETDISTIYEPAHTGAKTALTALTRRIKKYELLGLGRNQQTKETSTYRRPQLGYGAGYVRR